jgi:HrpA-like RNA helicase
VNIHLILNRVDHAIVQVRIAKLLLLATTFRCIRPVLDISACLSHRTPFAAPFDMMGELNAARDSFSTPAGIAPLNLQLALTLTLLCLLSMSGLTK